MDPRAQEILDAASERQRDYVIARLTHPDISKAARAIGMERTSPHNWDNLKDLEEAVTILKQDKVEAAVLALRDLIPDAVIAVRKALKSGKHSAALAAVKILFDRAGLPPVSRLEGSGKGGAIPLIVTQIVAELPPEEGGDV